MKTGDKPVLATLLLSFLLLLAGCPDTQQRPLKVATNPWPGYEPLYLAQYLEAYRSDVEIVQLPSATDVMRAFRNGSVAAAGMTLDEALLLASQGEALTVLMAMDFSNGADVVMGWKDIPSLSGLRGRRVGVESTALGATLLMAALDQAGLTLADVQIVNLPVDRHADALLQHEVDAVVTFEPVRTQLKKAGAVVLFDSSLVPDLIVDVLVVRRDALEPYEEQLKDLLRGYFEARSYMVTHPAEAHAYIARRLRLTPLELQQAYSGLRLPSLNDNIRWLSGNPSPFQDQSQQLFDMMRAHNLVSTGSAPDLQAEPRWVEGVRP